MIPGFVLKSTRLLHTLLSAPLTNQRTVNRLKQADNVIGAFDFEQFKTTILAFIASLQADQTGIRYRYSGSCNKATLYASAYGCMTLSLLDELNCIPDQQRKMWIRYFNEFQSPNDGLFYDPAVDCPLFHDADWWGARHLALHMISAYAELGARPPHPFHFLSRDYSADRIALWMETIDWNATFPGSDDVDNKIMNVGCLLQYQRDIWCDDRAADAAECLREALLAHINPATGMWGNYDVDDPHQRSRMVQFAYHLLVFLLYDHVAPADRDIILHHTLATRNSVGGFGVKLNSSACEDIDSIDILIRMAETASGNSTAEVNEALRQAWRWVMTNQVDDGGFVFRLFEPFRYGHAETSSQVNQGAMLPTWFRTLSLAYLAHHLKIPSGFNITSSPGYEYLT